MPFPRRIRWSLVVVGLCWLLLFLPACSHAPVTCVKQPADALAMAPAFIAGEQFPFRYPLDEIETVSGVVSTPFCAGGQSSLRAPREYHAAEDYLLPAGTPVYAMADGEVSYSGTMGGYGWLVIVDHPQVNLYSLYGHLSPSRWSISNGPVVKG